MNSPHPHRPPAAPTPQHPLSRRHFLALSAAATAFSVIPRRLLGGAGHIPPSAQTTVAGIGTGGQGLQNLAALQAFPEIRVTAVCDVHRETTGYFSWNWDQGRDRRLGGREPARRATDAFYAQQAPSGHYRACRAYADYRELLDREDVDAVMIATPDHTHAVITLAALERRKHVYCEKPLTWSVLEARRVTEAARRTGVATQMGNQGQAEESARTIAEMIADGAIGAVHEVQVWSPARFWNWPEGEGRPRDTPPVPEGLDWDLWLGPAPHRPYHPAYHPWTWRNWWDFGTGLLGDLGAHKLSTVFKALQLDAPVAIEASSTKLGPEVYPLGVLARFTFPARPGHPPLVLSWYDGGLRPPRPPGFEPDDVLRDVIYLGERGAINGDRLVPETRMEQYRRPPKTLPRSPGHYHEWVAACRGGPPAGSDFVRHAGRLTETCLLGNVAVRAQRPLRWDAAQGKFLDDPAADRLLDRPLTPA